MMKTVIVGAGVGGIACARRLAAHRGSIEVTVIDRSPEHHFAPSFLWLLNGARDASQVSRPIGRIEDWGVRYLRAEVTAFDTDARVVATDQGDVEFDELVLAPGAELAPGEIDGLDQALSFYAKEDALALASALRSFDGGRISLVVPSMPYKCPAAPYEAAFLIERFLRDRKVRAQIGVHTVEPQPLPVAGPKVGGMVAAMLARRGIDFHAGRVVAGVDTAGQTISFEDGEERFDMLVAIPTHKAPRFVRESVLAGPAGWIPVDARTLSAAEHVHAIGDTTAIQLSNGKPLPKAGVFAHAQAHVVADNLIALATGRPGGATFRGHGSCFLEIGGGKAGVARGNFYAEPDPAVRMFPPSRAGHLGKVLFERKWLRQFGS
ncbi:MAG: FAD/NAD(P)-binding oxidoreductase [Solirubrobacterales bacterium]